jgi:hypothetical protein
LEQFKEFGKLRNVITHLAVPGIELSESVYRFAFQVVEPMIYDFWKADIVACYELFGEEEEYITEQLARYEIRFTRRA